MSNKPLVGVNLGGWLVAERWISPELFAGTKARDEYTLLQQPDGRARLRDHQKNFIREADWKWLHDHGVQLVRIPIGYWTIEGDAPYVSCVGRLDWAMKMAAQYNVRVLLCLHGAPGSQNGFDHSGRAGQAKWQGDKTLRDRTVRVLEQLARRYRTHEALWGIEMLNEPLPRLCQRALRNFYNDAYVQLRQIVRPEVKIVFHDAFRPRLMNGAVWAPRRTDAMMDIHWYHPSTWLRRRMSLQLYWRLVKVRGRLIRRLSRTQSVIIGEWSGAVDHEVWRQLPDTRAAEDEHIARQIAAYDSADVWCYWTYKTHDDGIWNFRGLVEAGRLRLK